MPEYKERLEERLEEHLEERLEERLSASRAHVGLQLS